MTGPNDVPRSDTRRLARRLLKKLEGGARLVRRGEVWLIAGSRGPRTVWPDALVSTLCARGLVREDGGGLVLAHGPDFADRHRVLETRRITDERGRDCYVVVNAAESPITLLAKRGLVSAVQCEAGEKLRRDFTLAQLSARMGVDYSAPVGRGSFRADLAETVVAARQRFTRAMTAAGPGLADVLFDVCCVLKGLDDTENARGWPRQAARIVLIIALDRLAAHYGMGAPARARMRSWSMQEKGS